MNAMDRQPRRVVADKVTMAHGGGGKAMRDLIEDVFTSVFCPPGMEDQARLMDDALFVFFDEGEDDLTEEARSNLSLFARYTAIPHTGGEEAGRLRVIAGCSKGERDGALCRQRAYVVERFLIAKGVPQAAFEASQSYGRYRPLEDTGFGVDEAMLNQYAMVEILD